MQFKIDDFQAKWISGTLETEAVNFAEKFGEHLCDLQGNKLGAAAMSTSQIRNFFGEIKRIQARGYEKNKTSFLLIRPKLAYAEARVLAKSNNKPTRVSDFRKIFERAHGAVSNEVQFQNFVDFLEAVLAYHKFFGGKD